MGPIFYALHKLEILRIPIDEEVVDLDISSHGGYAYAQEKNESEMIKYEKYNHTWEIKI